MIVRPAKKEDIKAIAQIISTAFKEDFCRLIKSPETVAEIFEDAIIIDKFFVGCVDDMIVAVCAVSDASSRVVRFNRKILRKKLGLIKSFIFGRVEADDLEKSLKLDTNTLNIEFVAVDENSRGRGYAKALVEGTLKKLPPRRIILEVKDNNPAAIKTYKSIGFKEYRKRKVSKRSYGCNHLICMELIQKKPISRE